jgi:hypothetical protein
MLDNRPEGLEQILRAAFLLAAQLAGLERTEMNRWQLCTSGYGIFGSGGPDA